MIAFSQRKMLGLVGPPRAGKDRVANYLIETRGFTALAIADQIKEEFGISKEDFEAAKITKNIDNLRKQLWAFSAKIKEKDPLYFVKSVMNRAATLPGSIVITDIRTENEINSFFEMNIRPDEIRRIYYIIRKNSNNDCALDNGKIFDSEITEKMLLSLPYEKMHVIKNLSGGVFYFNQELDRLFFEDDVRDFIGDRDEKNVVIKYIDQFNIFQKLER